MAVKNWLAAVAMSACVFGASSASAAIVTNGGFEDPVRASGTWEVYDSIPGWTKFDDTAGIEIQTGNVGGSTAYEGQNKVELDSHGGTDTNSGMYQQLVLGVGSHEFSFQYLGRTNNSGTNGIHYALEDGGVTNGTTYTSGLFVDDVTGVKSDGWQTVTVLFNVLTAGTYTLEFWAGGADDTLGGYIDDVQISAVPLPPAVLLFGAAMLGLGWVSRRRKA
ncbi:VPLPA-CTERM sorting domain-containing protein [Sneathiella glossodoripedis]|uniref:VPLPA-CTERM sorting domain-containing protein n=1 Tax=Sneathiella glossodoripedis TaxID=418853 RepID=UPI0004712864|nr:VPLPA-CTERM sorting domain-containing protein [Sneathiella glossodoripedis]